MVSHPNRWDHPKHWLFWGLLIATSPLPTVTQAGQIHALVVGIDHYQRQRGSLSDLQGAVNDAQDIAAALEQLGAEVTLLLDGAARRDAIWSHWDRLVAKAQPGDTLWVSYAGHGGQMPAQSNDSLPEPDGLDEVLFLGGYGPSEAGRRELIVDDEWHRRIAALAGRGVEVILVLDSCYSGTANRTLAPGRWRGSRFGGYGALPIEPPPNLPQGDLALPPTQPHELFVSANLANKTVREIEVEGQVRGLLSVYVARALRGHADADGDGRLTRGELQGYIAENVRVHSEGLQIPSVAFAGDSDRTLFAVDTSPPPVASEVTTAKTVGLAVVGADEATTRQLIRRLQGVRGRPRAQADLVWELDSGTLYSGLGDHVATVMGHPTSAEALGAVQGTVEKWRVLAQLKGLAESRPLKVTLQRQDLSAVERSIVVVDHGLYREGDGVTIAVEGVTGRYVTVFNLAATGEIRHQTPLNSHQERPARGDFRVRGRIIPPFGANHLVIVATPAPLPLLWQTLKTVNRQREVPALMDALRAELADFPESYQVGLVGLYSAPRQ